MQILASTKYLQYSTSKESTPAGPVSYFSESDQVEFSSRARSLSSTAKLFHDPTDDVEIPPGGSNPYGGGG